MMNAYANGYVPYPIDPYAIMQQYNGLVMDMQQPLLYGTPTRYGGYPPVQSLSASAEYDSAQSAHADSARAATDKELKITENSTCTTGEDKFNDSSNIITDSQVVDLRADAVETNIVEEYVMVSKDVECPDNEEVLDCLAVSVPLDANDDTNQRAYTGKDEISGKLSLTTNHTLNFRYDRNLLLDIYSKMDATEIDPPMEIR